MDPISIAKALSVGAPILKELVKRKESDIPEEVRKMIILHRCLEFNIETIESFYADHLDPKDLKKIEENRKDFQKDLLSLMALIQSSIFIFKNAALGNFVLLSLEKVSENLNELITAIEYESADYLTRRKMKGEGRDKCLESVKESVAINISILEVQKENWESLFEGIQVYEKFTANKSSKKDALPRASS